MIGLDIESLRRELEMFSGRQLMAISTASAQRTLAVIEQRTERLGAKNVETLSRFVETLWNSMSSEVTITSMDIELSESLVPEDDEDDWSPAAAYLQNAAAATAFALSVALEGSVQDAFWAVWQVYELADYEALRQRPDIDLNTEQGRQEVLSSEVVQLAISAIQADLWAVMHEISPTELRARVREDSMLWASLFVG